jgi:hypothetical protein
LRKSGNRREKAAIALMGCENFGNRLRSVRGTEMGYEMQILRVPEWGFDYMDACYFGRWHSVHLGPFLIFWGQMTDVEIMAWDALPQPPEVTE